MSSGQRALAAKAGMRLVAYGVRISRAVLLVTGLCIGADAWSWGAEGHRLVSGLAQERFNPVAAAEVARLLALEPGSTLASISTWADEVRSPSTARWHFVNFPRNAGCRFDDRRDCPGGACVVDAIGREVEILRSNAPDDERLVALKFVVHLVADAQQPLHAAFADDRGGNRYQVQAYGRGTNLHAVWDTGLISHWVGGRAGLRADVALAAAGIRPNLDPQDWAEESCRVASRRDFYPSDHLVGEDYGVFWAPVLVERLAAAVVRTAAVLNAALTPR